MADGFIWCELVTNDMNKAVAFYKKVVGWDVKESGMPGFTYMLFGKDGKDVGNDDLGWRRRTGDASRVDGPYPHCKAR